MEGVCLASIKKETTSQRLELAGFWDYGEQAISTLPDLTLPYIRLHSTHWNWN